MVPLPKKIIGKFVSSKKEHKCERLGSVEIVTPSRSSTGISIHEFKKCGGKIAPKKKR